MDTDVQALIIQIEEQLAIKISEFAYRTKINAAKVVLAVKESDISRQRVLMDTLEERLC